MYYSLEFTNPIKTEKSLDRLIQNQHVTLAFNPTDEQSRELNRYVGMEVECAVTGYGNDGNNEGYSVELPKTLPYFNKARPHITLSVSNKSKPVKTGFIDFKPIDNFTLRGRIVKVEF